MYDSPPIYITVLLQGMIYTKDRVDTLRFFAIDSYYSRSIGASKVLLYTGVERSFILCPCIRESTIGGFTVFLIGPHVVMNEDTSVHKIL